jgi:phosphatidylserine/phosphatidylglycerophosphate/cardiolipin synthase-like enzyme
MVVLIYHDRSMRVEGADLRFTTLGRLAVTALITAATLAVPAAAHAAEPDPVLNKAVFNDPAGTKSQQNAIYQQVARLIDRIPAGAELRMSMYHLNPPDTANTADDPDIVERLKQAHVRRVAVKIVVDQASNEFPAVKDLRNVLGTDDTRESFIVSCDDYHKVSRGCIGTRSYAWPSPGLTVPAYNHNKFIAISQLTMDSGRVVPGVVYQASANMTLWDANEGYNNALTLADPALYGVYLKYHKDLVSARHSATGNPNYYTDSGDASVHRAFFFPRHEASGEAFTGGTTDPIVNTLKGVTCSYKDETGATRQTDVRVMMLDFNRWPVAQELLRLRKAGCWVDVVATNLSEGVIEALTGGTTKVQTTWCRWTLSEELDLDIRVHHKYMLIDGAYSGDITPRTYTGSHNLSWSALRQADEALLRITGRATHTDYLNNFWSVRDTCRTKTPGGAIY